MMNWIVNNMILIILAGLIHSCGALGITAGAHRLWSHKSYKAKLPLRIILTFMQTVSFQVSFMLHKHLLMKEDFKIKLPNYFSTEQYP
jgi:fatty-acid desaturase